MTEQPTAGTFACDNWQEKPAAGEADNGVRTARASSVNIYRGLVEGTGHCEYTLVYRSGGDGVFSGYERITGAVAGRKGSLVLEHRGTFSATTISCALTVVPGSGTDELTGVTGSGGFTASHGEEATAYAFEAEWAAAG
ncbi:MULTISPECIES: DUF3224 domain-containing protein [Streptomycetaceae]|uniref:DUF3224 domain-containing protein n=1 Tax=Streptantibioticus cattleyicolor (strain ATCC 35852 / DSM 46488 / JCM 4925 / NBRC 14057 / NRRL 8057) TaxID=1003195 RepID=F8JU47_STREN|nr:MULTISPECIES: DUF3224 domain-containing protein [Streptomycetaceae]AEW93058.1 hypothetical protein SCATT_06870 [Streptantibioticus cattleyicolor NRRL 8057 = DSM 46488]MYS57792.1 DUF3224 domain-containing protein [Streptomyces sp. SID5468]CCB73417.1 conserved protein of unknown function [Streptantibioticus cattleyicolor NRRL 8057 = DSM 46488]